MLATRSDPCQREIEAFRTEAELCASLACGLLECLGVREGAVRSELCVGAMIPDFVVVEARLRVSEIVRLTALESAVLAELASSRLRVPALSRRLYAEASHIQLVLRSLVKKGAVARTHAGAFQPAWQWLCDANVEIIAVEAKLQRWRDAFEQAMAYQGFANRAYIAMPDDVARRAKVVEHCRAGGVGIIAVERERSDLVIEAKRRRVRSPDWVLIASRVLAERNVTRP